MELVDPHRRFHRSFLAAVDEFVAAGETQHAGLISWPAGHGFPGIEFTRAGLEDPVEFDRLARFVMSQRDPFALRPRAYVPYTELWIAEGDEYLGRVSLRHELNELLYTWGARRRGHASAALRGMLEVCRERGIDPVLVTCDVDNVPSRLTIEGAGGVYEDTREGKLRYWIDLDPD